MWQRPANTIPQLTRKGYQPHGFVWGAIFFDPTTCGYRVWKYSRRCMVHLAKTALGQGMCLCCCLRHPFLDWNSITMVWRDSIPNWILDGFKYQASTVSVWWAMGEGGSSTIKLACAVKTLVLSHHKLPLANACSKIDQVCPDNMVNINFYLQILPLWFKQWFLENQHDLANGFYMFSFTWKKVSTYPTYLADGF